MLGSWVLGSAGCALANADPGLVGNLLVERLVGATIHQDQVRGCPKQNK